MKGYAKVHHSLFSSDKITRLIAQHDDHVALAAIGLWTVMITLSSERLTDGIVPLRDLAGWGTQEVVTDCIGALGAVGLIEFHSELTLKVVGYETHNSTSEHVRGVSEKRKKSGALGGKQKKSVCLDTSKQPVSDSVSVFASDSSPDPDVPKRPPRPPLALVDPEPPVAPTAPIDARVRSALVRGYREAFEGRHRTMPTDVVSGSLDAAIPAVIHRASVTGRDPLELAAGVGPMWVTTRTSPAIPRWDWFVQGIGEILAGATSRSPSHDDELGEIIDTLGFIGAGAAS